MPTTSSTIPEKTNKGIELKLVNIPFKDNEKVLNVLTFGAVGDGIALDTEAIQNALDAATNAGGGVVIIPKGRYLTKPLRLGSNLHLHLENGAVLLGSQNENDYPEWKGKGYFHAHLSPYNARYLLGAEGAENISITGDGTIDGQGFAFYEENEGDVFAKVKDKKTRPARMLLFAVCKNVRIEGITCVNSPAWTFWMVGCENVVFEQVRIETDLRHMNADGIDIDGCRNVLIRNCRIRTGDDAVVLRSVKRVFDEEVPCEQVRVENCHLTSSCNAIRLSYLKDGDIRNVVMENITITDSCRGIICQVPVPQETPESYIQHEGNPGPIVENVRFSNIKIAAKRPVWFRVSEGARARHIGNIRFENLDITGTTPSVVEGSPEFAFKNIYFENVQIRVIDGDPCLSKPETNARSAAFVFSYCENVTIKNLQIEGDNCKIDDSTPVLYFEEVENLNLSGIENQTRYSLEPIPSSLFQ